MAELVSDATVTLIEPLVIPDLFIKSNEVVPDFSFLVSSQEYAQYYRNFELSRAKQAPNYKLAVIPALGPLLPLKMKHSFRSYWRYFRLPIERAKNSGTPGGLTVIFFAST